MQFKTGLFLRKKDSGEQIADSGKPYAESGKLIVYCREDA